MELGRTSSLETSSSLLIENKLSFTATVRETCRQSTTDLRQPSSVLRLLRWVACAKINYKYVTHTYIYITFTLWFSLISCNSVPPHPHPHLTNDANDLYLIWSRDFCQKVKFFLPGREERGEERRGEERRGEERRGEERRGDPFLCYIKFIQYHVFLWFDCAKLQVTGYTWTVYIK